MAKKQILMAKQRADRGFSAEASLTSSTGHTIKMAIVTVTPELAETWLATNDLNYRRLDDKRAMRLGFAMERGDWEFNGASLKFGSDDKLRDGQHRLLGCTLSGVSFETLVLWGIDEDLEMDRGKKRTLIDELRRREVRNPSATSALLQHLWRLNHGTPTGRACQDVSVLIRYHNSFPEEFIWNAVRAGDRARSITGGGRAALGAVWAHLSSHSDEAILEEFWDAFCTGDGLRDENDPINRLRQWYLRQRTLSKLKRNSDKVYEQALIILAWNKWLTNQPVPGHIRWRRFGKHAMEFPTPLGGRDTRPAAWPLRGRR